jgi:hypothetical protein
VEEYLGPDSMISVNLVQRPITGQLYEPRTIDDNEYTVGGMRIGREKEVHGENLPQCLFAHHKSHMTCPRFELSRWCGKQATKSLSYGMA